MNNDVLVCIQLSVSDHPIHAVKLAKFSDPLPPPSSAPHALGVALGGRESEQMWSGRP